MSSAAPTLTTALDDPRRRRTVLITICLALMAVVASVSGLNVAQQQLALSLHASQATVLWIVNGYTLALAALLLPLGAIGDRRGRRPVLLVGLAIFTAASVLAAIATTASLMIIARLGAGVGAAMIMPVTLAIITSSFPAQERSRAIGVWSAVAGAGGLLGMFLTAILIDVANWRYQFVLPIVLAAASIALTVKLIPDSKDAQPHSFDWIGALTSTLAVVALVYGLQQAATHGWLDPITIGSVAVGLLAAVTFVRWEVRQAHPLFDIRLLRQGRLAIGAATLLTVFAVMGGVFVVLFPYFEVVLGWSGLHSTVGILPMAVLMMMSSGLAPRLAERIGPRPTSALGIALAAAGLALMAGFVSVHGGYLAVLPGLVVMGFGAGLAMTPATEGITASLPAERQGVASALNDITREFGTALGVALLGSLVTAGYRHAIGPRVGGLPSDLAAQARQGLVNAVAAAPRAGAQQGDLIDAAQHSFVHGWQQAMWAGVGVMVLLFLAAILGGRPRYYQDVTQL